MRWVEVAPKDAQNALNSFIGIDSVKTLQLYAEYYGFKNNNANYQSFILSVKEGDVIKIKGRSNSNLTCCATCAEYPIVRNYATGDTRYTVSLGEQTITIPSGIKYFLCGLHDANNNVEPTELLVNGYDILKSVQEIIVDLAGSLNELSPKTEEIIDEIGYNYEVIQSTNRAYNITDEKLLVEGTKIIIEALEGVDIALGIFNGSTKVGSIKNGEIFCYTIPANTPNIYLYNSTDTTFKGLIRKLGNLLDVNEIKEIKEYIPFKNRYYTNLFCAYNGIIQSDVVASVIYEVKAGDEISLTANTVYNCWLFSDVYPEAGAYREGFGRHTTAPQRTDVATAPTGTKYLMISKVDTNNADTTPTSLLINGYNQLLSLRENIGKMINRINSDDLDTAIGQMYPIGTIESERAATSNNGLSADNYVGSKALNRKVKRDYFNTNIVAINHDDVSGEDLLAIRKIYNKYGFNGNFNFILSASRSTWQIPYIKALAEDGNDLGLHAFLDNTAWMHNKIFDLRPDGTMTFYGDSFATYGTYILYAMDDLINGYELDGTYVPANISQGGETVPNPNGKSVLQWAEYYYNELVDNTLGYSTKGTAVEKFAADYEGTYPTKQQIINGDFTGCGQFTTGLFKGCCSCCNYEAWDRIMEVSIAYIRHFYGINNFTGSGPHGARYANTDYLFNGFVYDDADHIFLQNGQCKVYSSRLKAWTSFYDTLKRFGIKNCGNYSYPEHIEIEAREGMYFGQKNIRSDFFDRPGLRANYLTLMGTTVHSPYTYTNEEFEAIWGDIADWFKYAYENAGVEVTKNGVTATICDYIKDAIDRINYCKDTGKIPTLSFDTIWNTPACSVAFELLCQYCYENDIELVPVEKARRLATSLKREWQRNYYPNPAFTQTLLNRFGGSSTALSAYLPDGMRLLSNTEGSITASSDGNHRTLEIDGNVVTNVKVYGLPEGSYKFSVNAKSTSGDATIKVYKRKVGDKVNDDTNTLIATINDLNSTVALREVSFNIPAPYKVPVDYNNPVSIISEGYENNVCIIEIRYDVPADGDLTIYEPKIEFI
jgi:hypothetical protein